MFDFYAHSSPRLARLAAGSVLLAIVLLAGCNRHGQASGPAAAPPAIRPAPQLSLMAQIGRKLFFEPSLSASGRQSCASCHSPEHAFGPPNDLAVQLGGARLDVQGARAAPKLTYLLETPNFSIGPEDDSGAEVHLPVGSAHAAQQGGALAAAPPPNPARLSRVAPSAAKAASAASAAAALVPQGGLFWDGRADTLQGQALGPLLNPLEMGNKSADEIVGKLRQLGIAEDFKALVGPNVLTDPQLLLSEALFAIARYESEERAFAPYDSKYDQYLDGKVALSQAELRGLKLFEDTRKGNCASCHPDRSKADGRPPAFTDYQFEALGVPRNAEIRANADPHYYDLGICGPARTDAYARQDANCGLFKTPSLRNVATRGAFFHNGIYHNLKDVLRFYAERDLHPEKFYPRRADGSVEVYDDLPQRYRANVDTIDAPFDRKPGETPALNEAEMDDIIAFLRTLTDGYRPGATDAAPAGGT
jgi:cytochrome c peroxidase